MMARMGGTVVMFSWFAVFALLTLQCLAATEPRDFMMRPGQPEVVEVTAGGTTCKLEFACKGGTGEAWAMTLEETSDGAQCTIGRTKPPTYLIVHEFKATITNPKLVIDEVQVRSPALLTHHARHPPYPFLSVNSC